MDDQEYQNDIIRMVQKIDDPIKLKRILDLVSYLFHK